MYFNLHQASDCYSPTNGMAILRAMIETDSPAVAARVRATIAAIPRTKSEIAELLGVTPQAITGWETTGRIGKKSLSGLADLAGKSVVYFLTGLDVEPADAAEWQDIPGYAQAVGLGKGAEAQEYAETHKLKFRADSLARKRLRPAGLAVMYGQGDSMLPRIHPGDAVLFDTTDTRPRDGALFVVQLGREIYVKRCELLDDLVYFKSDNPAGDHAWRKPKRMDAPRHPITILGRVRWIGSWED